MKYWIITTKTESSDEFAHIIKGNRKPLPKQIEAFLKREYPYEYEEVGHVLWEIYESVPVEI